MIPNQWYVILESKEVSVGKPVGVTRLGEKMVLWRDANGRLVCQADRCPHLSASLCQGKIQQGHLACPFHGFEYDSSGQCQYVPALGKNGAVPKALRVRTYPCHEEQGLVWIWWGEGLPNPAKPRYFDELKGFSYGSGRQHWPVHYSRAVENQLDVMHLPFVHHNTIGRGDKRIVDGPWVELLDEKMSVWLSNRREDGVPARKVSELDPPAPGSSPMLQFIFPNIWQLCISSELRMFVAFVPVDGENTLFYLRYYQRFMTFPVIKELVNWMGMISSRQIASQDRRVVINQKPSRTQLKQMGEILTQGDHAILTYRQHRHKLQETSKA